MPPAPQGWNKTIEDLFAEIDRGERASVGSPEADWARDYERSLIPNDMRFPQKGDVYEAIADVDVRYLTAWATPLTGGARGSLKAGDRVRVDQESLDTKPIAVYAKPIDYVGVEARLVAPDVRANKLYSGYYLSLKTVDLNRVFKLV